MRDRGREPFQGSVCEWTNNAFSDAGLNLHLRVGGRDLVRVGGRDRCGQPGTALPTPARDAPVADGGNAQLKVYQTCGDTPTGGNAEYGGRPESDPQMPRNHFHAPLAAEWLVRCSPLIAARATA